MGDLDPASKRESHRQSMLDSRYGVKDQPDKIIWNETVEKLIGHRSVRSFLSKPLPDGTIETMVAAAQSASTSSNMQQWTIVAVTDSDLKRQLGELASGTIGHGNPFINEAPALLLWVADLSRNDRIVRALGREPVVHDHVDAFVTVSVDTALAAQNATVAAESLGLGVCYLGSMRNKAEEVAQLINLPEYCYITFGLSVGWPSPGEPADLRPRLAQGAVLHRDRYMDHHPVDYVELYEPRYQEYRKKQGLKEKSWKEVVEFCVADYGYMDGRENLHAMLSQRGFKML